MPEVSTSPNGSVERSRIPAPTHKSSFVTGVSTAWKESKSALASIFAPAPRLFDEYVQTENSS